MRVLNWAIRLTQTIRSQPRGSCLASSPLLERMGAWLVGETAGRPFPLPVLGRLSRAQSKMAAPSPFRREPSSIFRRLSEPSHFVPSCRGTAHLVGALRQGLGDEGFVEGRNVAIEQRHADNQLD